MSHHLSSLKIVLFMSFISLFVLMNTSAPTSAQQSPQGASLLDDVRETGIVRVGIRFDNPPFSFITSDGDWVGFDVDLADELAERLGVQIERVRVDETTRISFLQEGLIDMAVASMNHTRSRERAIDFSITYFWDSQTFLVRDGEFSDLNEMCGRIVAMNAGSSAIGAWARYVEVTGNCEPSQIVEFTDKVAAVQALRDGAVDGYAEDGVTLAALSAGDSSLVLLSEGFNPVQFGIGVPEDDSKWRDEINFLLQDIWTDGTYAELYERWFGADADIQLPLGGEMEIWG